MPGIKITLIVLNKFQVEDLALSSDITAEDLISYAVDRLNLRWIDRNNKTVTYYLERQSDGKVLELGRSFADLGIRSSDVIALKADGEIIEDDIPDTVSLIKPPLDKDGQVTVKLKVLDAHKVTDATFDKDLTLGEILKQVLLNYNLPIINPKSGEEYHYTIASHDIGDFIDLDTTLRDAGVPSGDTLTVHRPADAGAGNLADAREMRLQKEYSLLMNLSMRGSLKGGLVTIEPVNYKEGCPVETYIITFKCIGIIGIKDDLRPIYSETHRVRLTLGTDFPMRAPSVKWLTPIWHPNVQHHEPRLACTNEEEGWWLSRELHEFVILLGEMVQYKHYNTASPADVEVANWVKMYAEPNGIVGIHRPVDSRPLLPPQRLDAGTQEPAKQIYFDESSISLLPAKPGLAKNETPFYAANSGRIQSVSVTPSHNERPKPSDFSSRIDFDQSRISLLPKKSDLPANES